MQINISSNKKKKKKKFPNSKSTPKILTLTTPSQLLITVLHSKVSKETMLSEKHF